MLALGRHTHIPPEERVSAECKYAQRRKIQCYVEYMKTISPWGLLYLQGPIPLWLRYGMPLPLECVTLEGPLS